MPPSTVAVSSAVDVPDAGKQYLKLKPNEPVFPIGSAAAIRAHLKRIGRS
jgi:hypothetical protein